MKSLHTLTLCRRATVSITAPISRKGTPGPHLAIASSRASLRRLQGWRQRPHERQCPAHARLAQTRTSNPVHPLQALPPPSRTRLFASMSLCASAEHFPTTNMFEQSPW